MLTDADAARMLLVMTPDNPIFEGLAPIDWWENSKHRYFMERARLLEARKAVRDAPVLCGVYVLFEDDDVIYVGQAVNLSRRLNEHKTRREIYFTSVAWVECPRMFMTELELMYWQAYEPPLNWRRPQSNGC